MTIYKLTLGFHITFVGLSLLFFTVRGFWMVTNDALLQAKFTRFAPHVIDSALLLTALVLVFQTKQYPLTSDWLTVKVTALVLYILLGMIALKRGKTRKQRVFAFVSALATYAFIVSVAYWRHPLGIFLFIA